MYSKLNPTQSLDHIDRNKFSKGIVVCKSPSDFYTLLIKKNLKKKNKLKILWGDQLSQIELENIVSTVDFFSPQQSYWIYNCEKINKFKLDTFIEFAARISLDIVLHFKSLKKNAKLEKNELISFWEVEDFKFWETAKMNDFLEKQVGSKFSIDLKRYLETLSFGSVSDVYQFLEQLKNYHKSLNQITKEDLITFDQSLESKVFKFLDFFASKDIAGFYNEVDKIFNKNKVVEIFKVLNFLKASFYKVVDEKYLASKPKHSGYDKSLQEIKNNSSKIEISSWIKQLSKLEISLKRSTDEFNNSLTKLRLS